MLDHQTINLLQSVDHLVSQLMPKLRETQQLLSEIEQASLVPLDKMILLSEQIILCRQNLEQIQRLS